MNIVRCELAGLLIIEPKVFGDARGFFLETCVNAVTGKPELNVTLFKTTSLYLGAASCAVSTSKIPPCKASSSPSLQGEVFDVAVDIRHSSSTFRHWHGLSLSADNKRQFFIPPGFAHGFQVLSETAMFHYKCTDFYSPED